MSDSRFGWISDFRRVPNEYVLSHNGIDGYFFLRFFKLLVMICAVGWPLTWAVLMSVYGTSHGGQMQFDKISFSNIETPVDYYRLFAPTFVAWVYYGLLSCTTFNLHRMLSIFQVESCSSSPVRPSIMSMCDKPSSSCPQ